ncbi:unnamed protein product, partial [Nesidiocoris tenuis]
MQKYIYKNYKHCDHIHRDDLLGDQNLIFWATIKFSFILQNMLKLQKKRRTQG